MSAEPPPPARRTEEARLAANPGRILWLNGTFMFLVVMPVVVPFLRSHGLGMGEVYTLQAIFSFATLVLELPSGYVADLLGRRRALVAACVMKGLAFSVLAVADGFLGFVVFELLAAVAISLFSGSDIALLYESLERVPHRGDAGARWMGRKLLWSQLGETGAALLGGALVLVSLEAPVWANAVIAWLPLPVALSLHEPAREALSRTRHRENVLRVYAALFRRGRFLPLLLVNQVVFGAATLLGVWAYQPYWEELGIGLALFGLLWALSNGAVALTGAAAHRASGALGFGAVAVAIALLPAGGFLGMAFAAGAGQVAAGVAAGVLLGVSRGLNFVVLRDALNVRVPAEMRATVNSVVSLGVRLVFTAVGPAVGFAMDRGGVAGTLEGLGWGFLVLAAVCVPPLLGAARRLPGTLGGGGLG